MCPMKEIRVIDHFLGDKRREQVLQVLNDPEDRWQHGAFSSPDPETPKYFYKHFAGFRQTGIEDVTPEKIQQDLKTRSPVLYELWEYLSAKVLHNHGLSRCYANAMPPGVGGGVHKDSPHRDHITAIYYPQAIWSHDEGGETLFFNQSVTEVIKAVVPKPDRLVLFSGVIPHVARPVYRNSHTPRITLMYKTLGRAKAPGTRMIFRTA